MGCIVLAVCVLRAWTFYTVRLHQLCQAFQQRSQLNFRLTDHK
jgi:hypothetical protein